MESITNEEFKQAEEKIRENYLKSKQTRRFRVTSGGTFEDFEDEEKAFDYFKKMVFKKCYASMNVVHPKLFKQIEKVEETNEQANKINEEEI
jgi:sugar phosphate isomerase/epimerase